MTNTGGQGVGLDMWINEIAVALLAAVALAEGVGHDTYAFFVVLWKPNDLVGINQHYRGT